MVKSEADSQLDALGECERLILESAHSGKSRTDFLRDSARSIIEATAVDSIQIVLFDGHRRSFVACRSDESVEPRVDIRTTKTVGGPANPWSTDGSKDLESVCNMLMASRQEIDLPWFSKSGVFFVEDLKVFTHWNLSETAESDYPGLHISPMCRSLLIMPVEGTRKRIGLALFGTRSSGLVDPERRERLYLLAQSLGFASDLRSLQIALRERVKELTCLYGIAHLVAHVESSLNEVLQGAVELLPPAWLYPEVAAARITVDHRTFVTAGVDNLAQSMKADIVVGSEKRGEVEVGYLIMCPELDEGPFLFEERHLIDTIAREISFVVEQKTHDEETKELQSQLRHADRLATIGQLAAGVAHELNEPLSSIMGFAQLAAKQPGTSEEAVRDMNKIVAASLHARDVIKELLVFARATKTVRLSFNLNDLIRDGLFFLEARFAKAGISLVCDLDPKLPNISADRSQLLQVITNLAVNAVQAMPNGGRLEIGTVAGDGFVTLSVEDNGAGIEEAILKDIFHPFFTTKDVQEGTGLGLSVVHGIIASHGGQIDVDSRPGEGSRFHIQLPVKGKEPNLKDLNRE